MKGKSLVNVVFHLLHSLTLNLSYPSPLVSFMRPRLTGEINWECNFIFSGGLRETRWTRVKMSFTSEHFDLSFVPPPLSPLPFRKSMSTERLTLVRREMEAGSRSRTTSSSNSSGGKRYQPRAAWCCELYSVFLNSWAPSHTWFMFYACDVREAIISHIFCRARCYGEKQKSVLCVGMKTNWKLFILPPTSPESASHTVWTRCATRQGGKKKSSVRVFGYGNTKSYFRYHISDI